MHFHSILVLILPSIFVLVKGGSSGYENQNIPKHRHLSSVNEPQTSMPSETNNLFLLLDAMHQRGEISDSEKKADDQSNRQGLDLASLAHEPESGSVVTTSTPKMRQHGEISDLKRKAVDQFNQMSKKSKTTVQHHQALDRATLAQSQTKMPTVKNHYFLLLDAMHKRGKISDSKRNAVDRSSHQALDRASLAHEPESRSVAPSLIPNVQIEMETPLSPEYFRTEYGGFKCFPGCPQPISGRNDKTNEVQMVHCNKCSGDRTVVANVKLDASIDAKDLIVFCRLHSVRIVPKPFHEMAKNAGMVNQVVNEVDLKKEWIEGKLVHGQSTESAQFVFKPRKWMNNQKFKPGYERRSTRFYIQFEAFVKSPKESNFIGVGSGFSSPFKVTLARPLDRWRKKNQVRAVHNSFPVILEHLLREHIKVRLTAGEEVAENVMDVLNEKSAKEVLKNYGFTETDMPDKTKIKRKYISIRRQSWDSDAKDWKS